MQIHRYTDPIARNCVWLNSANYSCAGENKFMKPIIGCVAIRARTDNFTCEIMLLRTITFSCIYEFEINLKYELIINMCIKKPKKESSFSLHNSHRHGSNRRLMKVKFDFTTSECKVTSMLLTYKTFAEITEEKEKVGSQWQSKKKPSVVK